MRIKILFFIILFVSVSFAQIQVSGQLDVVVHNSDARDYSNKTFAGFSNFDALRLRLFFDAQPAENVTVFTQVLVNEDRFNLYAAYMRLSLFEKELNMHIGLIPNTVGIWGPRTYSDKNPFIGTPLMYTYHSSYILSKISGDVTDFVAGRGKGYENGGLPILYDFCWNTGIELFGSYGIMDWSIAAISGSVTHPSRHQEKSIPQFTTRLVFLPIPEITFGVSGFWGSYLTKDNVKELPGITKSANDLINKGGGFSFVLSRGYFEIFSETFWTAWDHPYFAELSSWSSYVEFKYKFAIQWYAAIRGEVIRFSDLSSQNDNGSWDYPLNRYDMVLGYHVQRNLSVKLDAQFADNLGNNELDDAIIAMQIAVSF